ncbi:dynein axonemal heavy chain 7-like [Hetaerina americana]|uniref:dynein axonemal heavy chain 7-like n=1 Tax=Hetaerina americana TaxID=62018 RepID=UPI003A7F2AD7
MDKHRRKVPQKPSFPENKFSPDVDSVPSDLFTPPKHLTLCKKPKLRHQFRPDSGKLGQHYQLESLNSFYQMLNDSMIPLHVFCDLSKAFDSIENEKKLSPFALLRKERESYRKKLVKIILQGDTKCDVHDDQQIPNEEERLLLRYYYYIHHGIDTIHVAPIEISWLKNICGLVPLHLKTRWITLMDELTDEIREDFLIAIKKAVVDFVLQDPAKGIPNLKVFDSEHRREVTEMFKRWRPTFLCRRAQIEKSLNIAHPCIAQILSIWHQYFRYSFYSNFCTNINIKNI